MTHHGWFNLDLHDLSKFAQANGFNFQQRDIRQGFIQQTGTVDAIVLHHVLEHFDAKEAVTIVRELRRVIKPNGGLRIIVPDMNAYIEAYQAKRLGEFDEMNGGSAEQATQAGKFHALLYGGDHKMAYDVETLLCVLAEAGFRAMESRFCHAAFENVNLELILSETNEHDYGGTSLFVDAVPLLG
jgi:SAM-dependent methyltransferase